MDISVHKLLAKIENELMLAKGNENAFQLREKVYSMKILCELILEEPRKESGSFVAVMPEQQRVTTDKLVSVTQPQKIEMNEEANGDSLLDF